MSTNGWRRRRLAQSSLVLTLCALMGMLAAPAAAQVTTTVLGTVKDTQGGVLPGATVVLISETRGTQTAPAVTNDAGDFVLPSVVPDTYTLQVEMPSFKTLKRTGLIIGADPRVVVGTLTLE
ncbi:MAG TPA: carboxypeptidase-like regulatory domain-containing protein, partial [Vicinamibacterales bacterium]|nr:carboxypeptidase-like regulatory domain-containing protein [Vicinamibacterales bacterium]